MYNLIIVGGGGLAREAYSQLIGDTAHGKVWQVTSFIDDIYEGVPIHVADGIFIKEKIRSHIPQEGNVYVMAIASPFHKKEIADLLIKKGAVFVPICTKMTAGFNVDLNNSFYGFDVRISNNVNIGRCCYVDSENMISHDVTIGDFCHLGPRNFIAGGVTIGSGVVIHGASSIAKGVSIGDSAEVSLGSVVLRDVPPGASVLGNPARVIYTKQGGVK